MVYRYRLPASSTRLQGAQTGWPERSEGARRRTGLLVAEQAERARSALEPLFWIPLRRFRGVREPAVVAAGSAR